jgi:CRISPR-associated protein Cas2
MDIVIGYDVNTMTREGRYRLRKVAKTCEAFGIRVQYSLFECSLSETQFTSFKLKLLKIIDTDDDSLRIYHLKGGRASNVETYGRDGYIDFTADTLIL